MGSQSVTLSFRAATSEDIPALLPLIKRAYRGGASRAGWTTEADLVDDDRIDAAGLLTKISEPTGAVLVATDSTSSGSFVACCEVLHQPGTKAAYFGLFAVDPLLQGGGIGKAVLAHAEGYARSKWGVDRMEMTVIWTRSELIAWYGRRGYRKTGERREFPYEHLVNGKALRDDLWFEVLEKDLVAEA
ncbi:Acetyltransferase [Coniochaeta hoffmannii]|uniref:Acetyltransferase n=1 Tax=Coniochaeta hoffmannii TaxID=91930 RepID=A0AA38VEP7_9PEZI|nr:Acetyltransferase [Coniochaeta hoffmannii]